MRSLPSSSSFSYYCTSHPELSPSSSQACLLKVPRFRPVPRFHSPQFNSSSFGRLGGCRRRFTIRIRAFDGDSFDSFSFDNSAANSAALYAISSSEGEDSDGEYALNLVAETSAERLRRISKDQQRHRIKHGMFMTMGLITFLTMLLLLADCCAWKIVRLPLPPFQLSRPFFISAVLVSCAGYLCVPLFNSLKIHQTIKKHGPVRHHRKRATPTMGGLFFVPIGLAVAKVFTGFSSVEVSGAAAATVVFAAIGLVDDAVCLFNSDKNGLSAWLRILLEAAAGTCFAFWLNGTSISSPYGMKMLVPLPAPLGLVFLGKLYLLLTSFCFVSMGNGVNLTDGLDGLAGGVSALAFAAMSIAVLPICPDLAVFGASMAGACVGFLTHNRYRASIFMGDTGSLALGAALAAMAACSGMFLPLFISSGIFVLEAASVIIQVGYYKISKVRNGRGMRFLKMAPFHHHLELSGLKEPTIVGFAYILSSLLSLFASYIALISA